LSPGGCQKTCLRYPHTGVRVQQHTAVGMEQIRMGKGYTEGVGRSIGESNQGFCYLPR